MPGVLDITKLIKKDVSSDNPYQNVFFGHTSATALKTDYYVSSKAKRVLIHYVLVYIYIYAVRACVRVRGQGGGSAHRR